jgi:hypothetical protein
LDSHERPKDEIRVLPQRFADVDRHAPFVASVTITPVAKLMPK